MKKALICAITGVCLAGVSQAPSVFTTAPRNNYAITSDQRSLQVVHLRMVKASYHPSPTLAVGGPDAVPASSTTTTVVYKPSHPAPLPAPHPTQININPAPVVVATSSTWCKGSAALTATVMSWEPTVALYGPGGKYVQNNNPWPVMVILQDMCRESGGVQTAVNGGGPAYNGGPACGLMQLYYCPGPQYLNGYTNIAYAYNVKYLKAGLSPWRG